MLLMWQEADSLSWMMRSPRTVNRPRDRPWSPQSARSWRHLWLVGRCSHHPGLGGLAALRATWLLSDSIAEQMAVASHNERVSAVEPGDIPLGVVAVRQPLDPAVPIPIPGLVVPYGGKALHTVVGREAKCP